MKEMLSIERRLVAAWYNNSAWLWPLAPFSWVFGRLAQVRRVWLQNRFQGHRYSAPVVVVGNISVGGSGKTPLVIALVKALAEHGLKAGVVSRGYGGQATEYPLLVGSDTCVEDSGDEPLLIAHMTAQLGCPVVVDPDRSRGVNYLLATHRLDVVLTDDGLQHYRLHRDIEIAVVDASRGLGNRRLLPTGPLREPIQRLHEVDFVIANGDAAEIEADAQIQLLPQRFRNLASGREVAPARWDQGSTVNAVAAIGNPQRFAATLESLGLDVKLHAKDDHRPLRLTDLLFDDNKPVIITAKDAVKLVSSVADNVWVLDVETVLPSQFVEQLLQRLHSFQQLET